MAIDDLPALQRREGGYALVEDVPERGLGLEHAHAQMVVVAGDLPGNLQVEPALVLDGGGRDDQRAQAHVDLARLHQTQGFALRLGWHDGQVGEVAGDAFEHRGAARQGDGLALQRADVGDERVLLAGDDHVGVDQQRFGEDQPLVALGRAVEEAQRQTVAGLGGGQALLPGVRGMQLQIDAGALADQGDEVGRHAGMPAGLVDQLERPPVGIDAHRDRRVGLQIGAFRFAQLDNLAGCRRCQPEQHEQRCQSAAQRAPGLKGGCAMEGPSPGLRQVLADLGHVGTSSLFCRDQVDAGLGHAIMVNARRAVMFCDGVDSVEGWRLHSAGRPAGTRERA
ncbi:hypothetical protein D3C75_636820 [compost metagenome]